MSNATTIIDDDAEPGIRNFRRPTLTPTEDEQWRQMRRNERTRRAILDYYSSWGARYRAALRHSATGR
jgi:hypothetical protein